MMEVKQKFLKSCLCDLCGYVGSWCITVHNGKWLYMALCNDCKKSLGKELIKGEEAKND